MTDTADTAQTNTDAEDTGAATDANAGTDANLNNQEGTQNQDSQDAAGNDNNDGNNADGDKKGDEEGYYGAPESYADFTLPEGVEINDEQIGFLKELDLNQAGAQKLIDYEVQRQAQQLETIIENHNQQQEEWIKEIKQDKDIGGVNFEKSMATANAAVEKFATDEFKALLKPFHPETNPTGLGLGNNPEFNRVFIRIGKAIAEDSPDGDTGDGSKTLSQKERLEKRYPNTKT